MTEHDSCDVLIVGGGLVGNSLACALEGAGLRCLLVEASAPVVAAPSFDERNLALAGGSVNALDALGVWRHLSTPPAPIRHIHVSSSGDFGAVRLDAARRGVEAFGRVVVARELGRALDARVDELRDTCRLRPARVDQVQIETDHVLATLRQGEASRTVQARLLVAADGTDSAVRAALGIECETHDYAQTLFVSVLQASAAPPDTAWERFTPEGPVALLPLGGGRLGSVCTVPSTQAAEVAAQDDAAYAAFFQQRFGWRAGRFTRAGRRSAYPLRMRVAQRLAVPRAVLVGNAAQTLHPIGAQGFNLGLRDALTLAEVLSDAQARARDIGADATLAGHVERRLPDRSATLALSDGLARVFGNTFFPLRLMRSAGFVAMDRLPMLADGLVTDAMGFGGDVSRWARGAVA